MVWRNLLCLLLALALLFCSSGNQIEKPVLTSAGELFYPPEAIAKSLQGTVELHLLISKTGEVEQAVVMHSSGSKILDNAALDYTRKLKFAPVVHDGNPVYKWMSWKIVYRLQDDEKPFKPQEYFENILKLQELAEQAYGTERKQILQDIYNQHEAFLQYWNENPRRNFNPAIWRIVRPEVRRQWEDFFDAWPLRFAVFHDFLVRYPDAALSINARARLVSLLMQDRESIQSAANEDKISKQLGAFFTDTISRFLKENYPEEINGS